MISIYTYNNPREGRESRLESITHQIFRSPYEKMTYNNSFKRLIRHIQVDFKNWDAIVTKASFKIQDHKRERLYSESQATEKDYTINATSTLTR